MNDPGNEPRDHLKTFLLRHKDAILVSWLHNCASVGTHNPLGDVNSRGIFDQFQGTVSDYLSLCIHDLEERNGIKVTDAKLSLWIDETRKLGLGLPDIVESVLALKRVVSGFIMDRLYYKPREVKILIQSMDDIFDHTLLRLSLSFSKNGSPTVGCDPSGERPSQGEAAKDDVHGDTDPKTLSSISSELQSPLTSIIDHTRRVVDKLSENGEGDHAEALQEAEKAFDNARHLLNIFNGPAECGRTEECEFSLKPESFDLKQCITDALSTLSPLLTEKGIRASLRSPDILPPLYADSERTRQIILNLLTNTVKHTPPRGNIAIEVAPLTRQNGGENGSATRFIKVTMIDNGMGIDTGGLPFISKKGGEARSNGDEDRDGSGLGLYIARRLVELQGGEIWSKNRRRKGSRFSFTLPTVYNKGVRLDPQPEIAESDTSVN